MPGGTSSLPEFHWAVSHTRGRITPHFLDFENFPAPFKSYDYLARIELRKPGSWVEIDLHSLFDIQSLSGSEQLDEDRISQVLFLAWGVTGKSRGGRIPWFFRTVPSAGGLHPCHVYASIQNVDKIETGVYYCDLIQEFLGLIQKETSFPGKGPALSFFITTEIFKSTWKYRDRAFRYLLLDTGHLVENFMLAIAALGFSARVSYDFDDLGLSRFLDLDFQREIPLAWIDVWSGADKERPGLSWSKPDEESMRQRADQQPGSAVPQFYPLLEEFYQFTGEGKNPGNQALSPKCSSPKDSKKNPSQNMDYVQALFSRRSRRNFTAQSLGTDKAQPLLTMAASLLGAKISPGLDFGVSCKNVEGMEDGIYQFSRKTETFALERRGDFQERLSRVCLDQTWIRNAAMNFLFITDLAALERESGPRGYRHVFMDAGRMGQRIYLAAQGLGLGCCAVGALYDDEAQALLDLKPDTVLFYVVSAGPVQNRAFS